MSPVDEEEPPDLVRELDGISFRDAWGSWAIEVQAGQRQQESLMAHPEVTMSSQTVHNPDEPRHFMRIKPVGRRVEIRRGEQRLAVSDRAVWVLEVGRDVYDPVVYLPREDVEVTLHPVDRSTHCPLKGDASYYRTDARPDDDPDVWAYEAPFDWATELATYVAFDGRDVELRQLPT